MSYGVALGWAVSATLLLIVVTQGFAALRRGAQLDLVTLTGAEALVYVLAVFGVLRIHAADRRAKDALGLRRSDPGLAALGLGLGLALLLPVESIRQLVERRWPTPVEELAARATLLSADTLAQQVVIVACVACVGPLVEELFFRGALFGALARSRGAAGAAVTAAIAFTLSHLDLRSWPALVVVAAVLSHLRAASGSLLPCLALHVGFNAATVIGLFTGVTSVTRPMPLTPAVVISSWLVTMLLVGGVHWLALRSPEAEEARAEDAT
jgi:membrane protease YdiL (CAAX protease family)